MDTTARPTPADKLTLIASIAGSARGADEPHTDRALWRIAQVLDGLNLDQILDLEMQHRRHGND